MSFDLTLLQQQIGYQFSDASLARRALTHSSANKDHNERMEFLGDALLGFLVAEQAYHAHPQADEGDMSIMRAESISRAALGEVARRLELGELLELSAGESRNGGRERGSILGASLEALAAAVYLDGGLDACREFVRRCLPAPGGAEGEAVVRKDNKSRLQELMQAEQQDLPDYETVEISGLGHEQTFKVRCSLPVRDVITTGSGVSRRAAEQMAAGKALAALGQEP